MAKAKYTQQKDGRWQARVWDGTYNANGTKHRITLRSNKSSRDLELKVRDLQNKVEAGEVVVDRNVEFISYCQKWRTVYKGIRAKNTQAMYDYVIKNHFRQLEGRRLMDIRKIDFQNLINDAADTPRTCEQIILTFRQVIKSAVADQLLPANAYLTICEGVTAPKYKAEEKRCLTPEEKEALKTADFTPMDQAYVYILYGCGLRRGEALALTIFDIDFKTSEISVNKALAFDGNTPYIKDTKSLNGRRKVFMPDFLKLYLKDYIRGLSHERLFAKQNGDMVTRSAYVRMWQRITSKMNQAAGGSEHVKVIYGLTAHIFRHNYCTSLCYQVPDISLQRIAYLMGDELDTIIKVYSHLSDEKKTFQKPSKTPLIFKNMWRHFGRHQACRRHFGDIQKASPGINQAVYTSGQNP